MSIFEKFRKIEGEESSLADERREEAVRRAQEELKERLKKKEKGEGEGREEIDLTQELDK